MEWIGWLSFILVLWYSGKIKKIDKLERKMKKNELKKKGETKMSKLIMDLVGKRCVIKVHQEDSFELKKYTCNILEADEEWIKISYSDKKENTKVKMLRVDNVVEVEFLEETEISLEK